MRFHKANGHRDSPLQWKDARVSNIIWNITGNPQEWCTLSLWQHRMLEGDLK